MNTGKSSAQGHGPEVARPWYREPWPWIIIGLLGTVILASLATLWIAVANPDRLVVDDRSYDEIKRGLRAQDSGHGDPMTPSLTDEEDLEDGVGAAEKGD